MTVVRILMTVVRIKNGASADRPTERARPT